MTKLGTSSPALNLLQSTHNLKWLQRNALTYCLKSRGSTQGPSPNSMLSAHTFKINLSMVFRAHITSIMSPPWSQQTEGTSLFQGLALVWMGMPRVLEEPCRLSDSPGHLILPGSFSNTPQTQTPPSANSGNKQSSEDRIVFT